MRIRYLIDHQSGKTWGTICEEATVRVRSGLPGKEKENQKPHKTANDALLWAEKEEWSRIKKGFVLDQPTAQRGEPRMQCLRGGGYTGAMLIADIAEELLCNSYDETRPGDVLFLLDAAGCKKKLPEFPRNRLAWKAIYLSELNRLIVKADHQILSCDMGEIAFRILSEPNPHPVSCLDACGVHAVWYEEPNLVVKNIVSGQLLLELPLSYEVYGNHSPQMEAALSPDSATLACCSQSGEIVLWDIASGKARASLSGDFEMIVNLKFSPDGRYLIAEQRYGQSSHVCFDLHTMAIRPDWIPSKYDGRTTIALSPDGSCIAVAQGSQVELFDFHTLESQFRFRIDHVVKRSAIGWIGPWLGVQTDYGCASLYVIK